MSRRMMWWSLAGVLVVAVSGCRIAKERVSLAGWEGQWGGAYALVEDPAMEPAYEAIAEAAARHSARDVERFFHRMWRTDFGGMEISGSTVTYYEADGTTVKATCRYNYAGKQAVSFGGFQFDWYKFELKSGEGACEGYKYLIATLIHSHGEAPTHWHMRYSARGFDYLIDNPAFASWWPTLGGHETTAEQMADSLIEHAEEMAAMF